MSWKRCWNSGLSHGYYESEDEQIVPDIDLRTSSSSSSSLSSTSSATSVDSPSSASIRGSIDTHHHHHHHHQASSGSASHGAIYRPVSSSSSASSYRNFPSKRDTFGNNATNSTVASGGGIFGQHRSADNGHSSSIADHYRVFGLKTSPSAVGSSSSTPSPFSWNNKSPLDTNNDYYGTSKAAEKQRSALEVNDFWEEKYSRIAVISTTHNSHFGPMVNKS